MSLLSNYFSSVSQPKEQVQRDKTKSQFHGTYLQAAYSTRENNYLQFLKS